MRIFSFWKPNPIPDPDDRIATSGLLPFGMADEVTRVMKCIGGRLAFGNRRQIENGEFNHDVFASILATRLCLGRGNIKRGIGIEEA